MITRIWNRLRRRRRWTEPDTLTRLPIVTSAQFTGSSLVADLPQATPVPNEDELLVQAHLFRLLGVGGPQ